MCPKENKIGHFVQSIPLLACIAISLLLSGCDTARPDRITERGFYYWKSVAGLASSEQKTLEDLQVKKLYLKFFDVVWNGPAGKAIPVAKIRFTDTTLAFLARTGTTIIPTIFITNESMQFIDPAAIGELAHHINQLLSGITAANKLEGAIREIQLDCDWTATTKDNYFSLLQRIQELPFFQQKQVSATIRLYQCKYRHKTGVPPVPRGLLMCYNMGNLKDPATTNSILDPAELEQYIGNLHEYPLPLDIGWPLFQWKVLYRDNTYKGLIRELPDPVLKQVGIANRKGNTYELLRDTLLNEYDLKKGDIIRTEDSNFDDVIEAAHLLNPQWVTSRFSVVLFHLDSLTLLKYSEHELEKMYNSLH